MRLPTSLPELITRVKKQWSAEGVRTAPKASARDVREFRSRYKVVVPDDLRYYWSTLNGMVQSSLDDYFIEFIPIHGVQPAIELLSDSVTYQPALDVLSDTAHWFIIADYLCGSHYYSIHLAPHASDSGACEVAMIWGSGYKILCNSWAEFLTIYLDDPERLFG